jgi:hypothetical protein
MTLRIILAVWLVPWLLLGLLLLYMAAIERLEGRRNRND